MIFIFSIAIVFISLIVYLFFRSEKLQKQFSQAQSESRYARKETKALLESLMLVLAKQDEFVKHRLQLLKDIDEKRNEHNATLKMIAPLINNFSLISRECLKGKGQLSIITKKCYENSDPEAYKAFTLWLKTQDIKVKRMWNSNTLNGYLSLVEALLLQQTKLQTLAKIQTNTKEPMIEESIAKAS
ncbi:MAG: hypothetical protein JKX78_09895 [Alteromonadaceae bacterium]|nr:hypothetical protein [Alteromonadaceae bacterium]